MSGWNKNLMEDTERLLGESEPKCRGCAEIEKLRAFLGVIAVANEITAVNKLAEKALQLSSALKAKSDV